MESISMAGEAEEERGSDADLDWEAAISDWARDKSWGR